MLNFAKQGWPPILENEVDMETWAESKQQSHRV